ncbi:MAG: HAD hydrolase family protein [bacterium]
MKTANAVKRAKKVKILLMDVDGVLTDGKMYYIHGNNGQMTEFKAFHSLDGIGLRMLRQFGILTGLITGRESPGTEERAKILRMKYAYQGFLSKVKPLEEILADCNLSAEDTAYIGDDWTDIPVMKRVKFACAPKNALSEVKSIAHFVSSKEGGSGSVREVCEFILKSQGRWKEIMTLVETARWDPLPKEEIKIVRHSDWEAERATEAKDALAGKGRKIDA